MKEWNHNNNNDTLIGWDLRSGLQQYNTGKMKRINQSQEEPIFVNLNNYTFITPTFTSRYTPSAGARHALYSNKKVSYPSVTNKNQATAYGLRAAVSGMLLASQLHQSFSNNTNNRKIHYWKYAYNPIRSLQNKELTLSGS